MGDEKRYRSALEYLVEEKGVIYKEFFEYVKHTISINGLRKFYLENTPLVEMKYKTLKEVAKYFGFDLVEDFLDEVSRIESTIKIKKHISKIDATPDLDELFDSHMRNGRFTMDDCMNLCMKAKLKRAFTSVGDKKKHEVLKETAQILNLEEEMKKRDMVALFDYLGRQFV